MALIRNSNLGIKQFDDKFVSEKGKLLKNLSQYHKRWNMDLVSDAFDFAVEMHKDQRRQTGEPYFVHPLAVSNILVGMKSDYITIAAALLHDVSEDCNVTTEELTERFGPTVALLVDGVTKISERHYRSVEEKQAGAIHKMLLSTLKDLRVILIKFGDRLHNMQTIDAMPKKSQLRIAVETRDVYVPLAHRFGIGGLARDLEDLTLKVLHPKEYKKIAKMIQGSNEEREIALERIIAPIRSELGKAGLPAEVFGRVKSMSSIFEKTHKREKRFDEILDLLAVRIVVKQKQECYQALGLVHDLYKPIKGFFTDRIALPKSNFYQSLHTKVRDQQGRIVEIQIRTDEMDAVAENGVAAHWRYKEGFSKPDELDEKFDWIRLLMESHQEEGETGEFLASLKINLFQDEIFVFTPKGELIQLPIGATPVDFAYGIHSDVGKHAIAAKVKGRMVALSQELESGDVVEVLTSKNQTPSAEWLTFVRTVKARSQIKRWLRETKWDQGKVLGEEMITNEISHLKLKTDSGQLNEVAQSFGYTDISSLYADIGSGVLSMTQVMGKLIPKLAPDKETLISRIIRIASPSDKGVRIGGWDDMVVDIADCCNPLPGESIVSFQEFQKGLTVHRTDCLFAVSQIENSRKVIPVAWDVEPTARFNSTIKVIADDRSNLLRDMTMVFGSMQITMSRIEVHIEENLAIGNIDVKVRNISQLTKLIGKINQIQGVLKVERHSLDTKDDEVSVNQSLSA